jgi:signal transduction histidine kinase
MSAWGWVQVLAAISAVVVAALALSERGNSPFRLPLTLLAINQFAWNAAIFGGEATADNRSAWVGVAAAPLFTPMALHYVLTFVGRRRALEWLLWVSYAVFGLQTLVATVDAVSDFELPGGFHTYAELLLVPSLPVAALGITLVWRHGRAALNEAERFRSKLLLVALCLVVVLLITDLLADMGFAVPRLATLGSFTFNVFLAQITIGITGLSRRQALGQAVMYAVFIVVAYLTLFLTLSHRLGVLVVAMAALSFGLLAAAGFFWRTSTHAREGLERFATVGRFSAHMAHDLKNPLAAAKGAAEFLSEELRRAQLDTQREFSELIVQQLDRLTSIIDRYQRLSNLQLSVQPVDLNVLVRQVLSLQRFGAGATVQVTEDLALTVPMITADPALLASVIENLVKNACEAMPSGGHVTVTTAVDRTSVRLGIKDTGPGMDPRTREHAFTLFFTTKTTGTGLGLAFVQQIARAHGGDVMLTSREGQGTMVEVVLPRGSDDDEPRYRFSR